MNALPDTLRSRLLDRRRVLALLGAAGGTALLAACGSDAGTTSASTTAAAGTGSTAPATSTGSATTTPEAGTDTTAACAGEVTPSETGGPFPADGTNDNGAGAVADVLSDPRAVRSDIRADLDGTNVQEGVPFTLTMTVTDALTCAPLPGAAVYVWHCTKDGVYSAYDSSMLGGDYSERSYLRGVQIADERGTVTFTTILPGRYQGRAFHIHFEVYADADLSETNKVLTSQLAIDDDVIDSLYAAAGYEAALAADTSNDEDNIFSDGVATQLLSIGGDVASGLTGTITVAV